MLGNGVRLDLMQAPRLVLNRLKVDATYMP